MASNFPDIDGDGMTDGWEMAHGLNPNDFSDASLDVDGDGLSNRDEFQAGTDPRNAESVLRLFVERTGVSSASVSFAAVGGRSYALQYREIGGDSWIAWPEPLSVPGADQWIVVSVDLGASGDRLIRVITPRY